MTCANGPSTESAIPGGPLLLGPVPRGLASGGGNVEGIRAAETAGASAADRLTGGR